MVAPSLASYLCLWQEAEGSDCGKGAVLSMDSKAFPDTPSRLLLMSHWHMGTGSQPQGRLQCNFLAGTLSPCVILGKGEGEWTLGTWQCLSHMGVQCHGWNVLV